MRLIPLACATGLLLGTAGLVSTAGAAPAPLATLRLAHGTVDGLAKATLTGVLAPTTPMEIGITLTDTHVAEENALLAAQADPASATYQHFLTPAEWDARFGVPSTTYDVAKAFATKHGLKVVSEVGSHDYLLLSGTAAQAEQTFSVTEQTYTSHGVAFFANTLAPLVPSSISGVLGLDSVGRAHLADLKTGKVDQGTCAAGTCTGTVDITDLRSAYDVTKSFVGTGQKVAVFGEGETKTVLSDLKLFEAHYAFPTVATKVVSVGDDNKDTAGDGEWDLDTQSSTGMANHAAGLVLYFGKDLSDASINGTYAKWADDKTGPHQANASFGECEPIAGGINGVVVGTQSIAAYNAQETQLRKARAEGRTLFASAGDQGGACGIGIPNAFENNGVPALNVPAASINAVGVGGTVLYTTGGTNPQRSVERGLDAGGGGQSFSIHADAYQVGTSSVIPFLPCTVTQQGTPDTSGKMCRALPDVSADSGDITVTAGLSGMAIYSAGQFTAAAGTSLSSPLTMGMWADIQADNAKGYGSGGLGFANLTIYKLGKNTDDYGKAFFDVTLGTNGQHASTTGYDENTGLGVINVAPFSKLLNKAPITAVSTPVKPTPVTGAKPPTAVGGGSTTKLPTTGLGYALPALAVVLLGAAAYGIRRRVH